MSKDMSKAERRSLSIAGFSHLTAIPVASRIGPLLSSSIIVPFNPGTRDIPPDFEAQYANIFHHVRLILEAAGGGFHQVARMEFWLANAAAMPPLEDIWLEHFPDADSRPARHTRIGQVEAMSASFTAYIN